MLKGLEFMHEKAGILHGDMKPHNVLLVQREGKFIVQLCDFGLAKNHCHFFEFLVMQNKSRKDLCLP